MNKADFEQEVLAAENTLYRIAKSMLASEADCEDAVSEAILKAYTKLGTLRDEKFFRTWLVRILINECKKIYKFNSRTISYENIPDTPDNNDDKTDSNEIYSAIMKLPEKIRIAVTLYYAEGYSTAETAAVLHIPSGTVKSRLSKGRTLLKNILKEEL